MARNRQRAKQRRAARLSDGGSNRAREQKSREETPAPEETSGPPHHDTERELFADNPELMGTAPPEDLGFSDATLDSEQETDEAELDEDFDFEDEEQPAPEGWQADTAGRRGTAAADRPHGREREHGKVLTFLGNVWAELQRVQWPDRKQVTTLTAIVLGFVLIAGSYLGLLDVVFSEVVKQII